MESENANDLMGLVNALKGTYVKIELEYVPTIDAIRIYARAPYTKKSHLALDRHVSCEVLDRVGAWVLADMVKGMIAEFNEPREPRPDEIIHDIY